MQNAEIENIKNTFIKDISPTKIYLFGSYATGKSTENSDIDFYLIVDNEEDVIELTTKAYRAIRDIKQHPVDIVIGTSDSFNRKKDIPSVEYEVDKEGVLLYG